VESCLAALGVTKSFGFIVGIAVHIHNYSRQFLCEVITYVLFWEY
jgi:hypothetical protein